MASYSMSSVVLSRAEGECKYSLRVKYIAIFHECKAKQIKLIVSQAFFLGKPMRDAAFFFFFANHNNN